MWPTLTRETPCSRVVTTRYDTMVAALDLASCVSVVVHSGASSRLQRSGCTHCQESALARSSDGTCKNRTSKWVRARMPTIGSKPVPLATLDAREGGGSRGRTSRKAPLARGLVGEVLGAAPDASATPKDRYSRLRPLRPAAGVVRQSRISEGVRRSLSLGSCLGRRPKQLSHWRPSSDPLG